jgi:ankyrin repeat protein
VVKVLLRFQAAVDIKDEGGMTSLEWAVVKGHETVVKLLQAVNSQTSESFEAQ